MSISRICKCGAEENIRFNFVSIEDEEQFHAREYKCNKCKNEMDIQKAKERKETPIKSGVLDYFPDAIRAVAQCSYIGNEQHNPGTELRWDRSKSGDELDALARHLLDAGTVDTDGVAHSAKVAWRALANLQKEIERERQEDHEERLLAQISEDKKNMADYMYDNEECDGLLGSHPLCCTDYCPCKEDEINSRIDVIGRNGNDGLHYGTEEDGSGFVNYPDPEMAVYGVNRGPCSSHDLASEEEIERALSTYPESNGVWVATSTETPCGWDNTRTDGV